MSTKHHQPLLARKSLLSSLFSIKKLAPFEESNSFMLYVIIAIMKKITILAFVLIAFFISSSPFVVLASATSTPKTISKALVKKHKTVKKPVVKKKAKKIAKKSAKKVALKEKILSAPLIDPNNPPSSPRPIGQ